MVRFAAVFLAVALMIYGLVDCGQTRAHRTRYMPKAVWLVLIVILPIVGPVAWLLFGTNREPEKTVPRRRAPDEDPDFLWKLDRDVKREQQRTEAERRAREADTDQKPGTGKEPGTGKKAGSGRDAGAGPDTGPGEPTSSPPPAADTGPSAPDPRPGDTAGDTAGETTDETIDETIDENDGKKDDS